MDKRVRTRRSTLTAQPITEGKTVATVDGEVSATKGSWLVQVDGRGTVHLSSKSFNALFEPLDGGRRAPQKSIITAAALSQQGPFTYRELTEALHASGEAARAEYVSLTLAALAREGTLEVVDKGGKKRARVYAVASSEG